MKVAFIGNSHLGRIKKEWDVWCKEHREIQQEYFIHRSMGTHPLRIRSDGAIDSFPDICLIENKMMDPREYDAVVIMGMSLGSQRVLELAHRFRRSDMPVRDGYMLTDSTWNSALDDILAGTDAVRLARAVKAHAPDHRLVLIPQAHPLEWVKSRLDFPMPWAEWSQTHNLAALHAQTFHEALSRLSGDLGAEIMTQPAETVASQIWTRSEFGLAQADAPDNPYWPKNDYFHMNDLFARTLAPHLHQRLLGNNNRLSVSDRLQQHGESPRP